MGFSADCVFPDESLDLLQSSEILRVFAVNGYACVTHCIGPGGEHYVAAPGN